MTPEYHNEVGIPRVAAIEHPYGRAVGDVHDRERQRAVLLESLAVLEKAKVPGQVFHLPFVWPEKPEKTAWHPPEISPIVKLHLEEIKKFAREGKAERPFRMLGSPGGSFSKSSGT